jgi:hypothetical protein
LFFLPGWQGLVAGWRAGSAGWCCLLTDWLELLAAQRGLMPGGPAGLAAWL